MPYDDGTDEEWRLLRWQLAVLCVAVVGFLVAALAIVALVLM